MKKQSKKFMLAALVLLAIAGLLALTSCKNDSVPEQGTSVQEETWLQEQKKELEGKTEGTYTITAPSYLTEGGFVKIRKLLDEANVPVDLDLSQATGLTYIAPGAFIKCPTLKSVKLPPSVTEIGKYAFQFCPDLREVTIPEGVTLIGDNAFGGTGLTEVTFKETGGWRTKNPYDGAESPDPINVDTSSTNAEKLREGDWHNKYLIRK